MSVASGTRYAVYVCDHLGFACATRMCVRWHLGTKRAIRLYYTRVYTHYYSGIMLDNSFRLVGKGYASIIIIT